MDSGNSGIKSRTSLWISQTDSAFKFTGHSIISHIPHSTDTFINLHRRKNETEKDFQMSFLPTVKHTQLTEIMCNFGLVMMSIYTLYIVPIQATFTAIISL